MVKLHHEVYAVDEDPKLEYRYVDQAKMWSNVAQESEYSRCCLS